MEVKPGYKLTEVGVIPEDWELTAFDTLGNVIDGDRGTQYPGSSDFSESGHCLFLNAGNVTKEGFRFAECAFISREKDAALNKGKLKRNDIVLTTRGTIGNWALYDAAVPFENIRINSGMVILRNVSSSLDTSFLYALFQSRLVRLQIERLTFGSAQPQLTVKDINKFEVVVPPLSEQRVIAEALSDVNGLLGGLDRLIVKKRDLKQAAMQQLLTGQTRLPGFYGEWEVKTLFELAERKKELFDDGDWIESEHITTQGIRLIQTGNIGIGSFVEKEAKKYIYEKSFTSLRCKQLRQGDLLVCRLADPAGRACVLPDIGEERIVTSVDVTIFRPPPNLADRLFLSNVFSTPEWFKAVSDRSGGTTHKRISRGALGRVSIKLPPLPEQTAIAAVLSDMDAELVALEQRREKTRALKQAMMQELLTGKTRLVAAGGSHARTTSL